jgi:cell division protein FtsB
MDAKKKMQIITVTAIIFIFILLVALVVNIVRLSTVNKRREKLEAQLAAIQAEISETQNQIGYITTDEYIDQYAREYLNMQGKDEEAFTGKE